LLASDIIRHTIDLKDISHAEIIELFDYSSYNSHCQWQAGLVSAAHSICVANKLDYDLLFNRWIIKTTDWRLFSLRVIYALPKAVSSLWSLFYDVQFQTFLGSQLHCLHLVFDDPYDSYMNTLAVVIRHRISYPTMIFEVKKALDNLAAFQHSVSPLNLPALKHDQFQYLLRSPAKYEREYIRRFHNNGWPFENASFHVNEYLASLRYYYSSIDIQAVLLVYSVPFPLLK
ncbi:unnamed protein product, partial [Rotaria socialis]